MTEERRQPDKQREPLREDVRKIDRPFPTRDSPLPNKVSNTFPPPDPRPAPFKKSDD